MTTNTRYGTWYNAEGSTESPRDYVESTLSEVDAPATEAQVDEIARRYTAAINEELPEGFSLNGAEFFGPVDRVDGALRVVRMAVRIADATRFWDIVRDVLDG